MLPLVAPGLVTTGLLAFIGAWNEFLFAVSFTQTPDKRTVPLAIFQFATATGGGYEIPWGSDHGRHRHRHHPADRAGAHFPEPHHLRPDRRRGQGLRRDAACRPASCS